MTTKQLTTGINWTKVREELDGTDWCQVDDWTEERTVFLGTVFGLYPSGKYYSAWARSYVTEREMKADADFSELLEQEASDHGFFITSGEGDPCDVLVGEQRDIVEDDEPEKEPEDND